MKIEKLVKQIEKELGTTIDFRSDAYVTNPHVCTPVMGHDKAHSVIAHAIAILKIDNVRVNIDMILSSMQSNTLKNELENLIFLAQEK